MKKGKRRKEKDVRNIETGKVCKIVDGVPCDRRNGQLGHTYKGELQIHHRYPKPQQLQKANHNITKETTITITKQIQLKNILCGKRTKVMKKKKD